MQMNAAAFIAAQAQIEFNKPVYSGKKLLRAAVETPFDHFKAAPPLILGPPGCGKTQIFGGGLARKLGRRFVYLCPSQRDPVDINGAILPEDGVAKHLIPDWQHTAKHAEEGSLLMFDEITNCNGAQQASLLQIAHEGLTNAIIVLAANPTNQAADGNDLTPPMVNRLCVLEWELHASQWLTGLSSGFGDVDFPVLPATWRNGIAETSALVQAYIHKHHSALLRYPTNGEGGEDSRALAGKPWPSQRSWTNALVMMAAARACDLPKSEMQLVEAQLISGCIGEGGAKAFLQWTRALDIPDIAPMLKSLKQDSSGEWSCSKYKRVERSDVTLVICSNILSWVGANLDKETFEKGFGLLCVIAKEGDKEVASHIMGLMLAKGGSWFKLKEQNATPRFPPYARKELLPVLQKVTQGELQ